VSTSVFWSKLGETKKKNESLVRGSAFFLGQGCEMSDLVIVIAPIPAGTDSRNHNPFVVVHGGNARSVFPLKPPGDLLPPPCVLIRPDNHVQSGIKA